MHQVVAVAKGERENGQSLPVVTRDDRGRGARVTEPLTAWRSRPIRSTTPCCHRHRRRYCAPGYPPAASGSQAPARRRIVLSRELDITYLEAKSAGDRLRLLKVAGWQLEHHTLAGRQHGLCHGNVVGPVHVRTDNKLVRAVATWLLHDHTGAITEFSPIAY